MRPIGQQLAEIDLQQAQGQQQSTNQRQQLESMAIGAAPVLQHLKSNDIDGARNNLTARKQRLIQEGKSTAETDEALQLIDTNPGLLKQRLQNAVTVGERLGVSLVNVV